MKRLSSKFTSYAASLAVSVALCPRVVFAVVTEAVVSNLPDFSVLEIILNFSFVVNFSFSFSAECTTSSFLGRPKMVVYDIYFLNFKVLEIYVINV